MNGIEIDDVLTWDLSTLWKVLPLLTNEQLSKEDKEIIENVREGISVKIPIYYLTNEWYERFPSSASANVYGHGKIPLKLLVEEIEARETALRKIIISKIDDGSITEPRN